MKKNNLKGSLILCTAALIWGLAFSAQSAAAKYLGSFTINFLRSVIGAVFLFIFIKIKDFKSKTPFLPSDKNGRANLIKGGVICGTALAVAANLQQFGIGAFPEGVASEARAGFITALYVILVPIATAFSGKKIDLAVWTGVIIAILGIYMLCFSGGFSGIYTGDILLFLCAVSFTVHILTVDRLGAGVDGVKLSCIQFAVCGIISGVLAFIFETVRISDIISALPPLLYIGVMSSGVAYTLQIVGQKYAEPPVASISMSLESVFAALGGWLVSGNVLSVREICGCALVFAAIILAQLPQFKNRKKAV